MVFGNSCWNNLKFLEGSPMTRKTRVKCQVETYQRLKKWYLMPPCITLSIIRYGSRVKWSNPGKRVAPSPTPRCSSYWKGNLQVTLDYGLCGIETDQDFIFNGRGQYGLISMRICQRNESGVVEMKTVSWWNGRGSPWTCPRVTCFYGNMWRDWFMSPFFVLALMNSSTGYCYRRHATACLEKA